MSYEDQFDLFETSSLSSLRITDNNSNSHHNQFSPQIIITHTNDSFNSEATTDEITENTIVTATVHN